MELIVLSLGGAVAELFLQLVRVRATSAHIAAGWETAVTVARLNCGKTLFAVAAAQALVRTPASVAALPAAEGATRALRANCCGGNLGIYTIDRTARVIERDAALRSSVNC